MKMTAIASAMTVAASCVVACSDAVSDPTALLDTSYAKAAPVVQSASLVDQGGCQVTVEIAFETPPGGRVDVRRFVGLPGGGFEIGTETANLVRGYSRDVANDGVIGTYTLNWRTEDTRTGEVYETGYTELTLTICT